MAPEDKSSQTGFDLVQPAHGGGERTEPDRGPHGAGEGEGSVAKYCHVTRDALSCGRYDFESWWNCNKKQQKPFCLPRVVTLKGRPAGH